MKRFFILFAVALFVSCTAINQEFVKKVDGYTKVILPHYKSLVPLDTTLKARDQEIRIQAADSFQGLVDDAKEE